MMGLEQYSAVIRRVTFATICFVLAACGAQRGTESSSLQSAAGQPIGQYRGYALINRDLQETVVDSRDSLGFNFVAFAARDGLSFGSTQALQPLLGEWTREGLGGSLPSVFRNGVPTAVSAFLYERIMGRLGEVLAGACDSATFELGKSFAGQYYRYRFSEDFLRVTRPVCSGESNLRVASLELWQLLVGYDFDRYFESLMDWIERTPDLDQMTPKERLEIVMRTVLLHPVFLLSY